MSNVLRPGWMESVWPRGFDTQNPKPVFTYDATLSAAERSAQMDEYTAAMRAYVPSPPRSIDRESRQFGTAHEAQRAIRALGGEWASFELPLEVRRLYKQHRFEQRTPEWFAARRDALTASDFGGMINYSVYKSTAEIIKKKLNGAENSQFKGNEFTEHGVIHEDCAALCYEQRTGAILLDFGLLSHHELFSGMSDETAQSAEQRLTWFNAVHPSTMPHDMHDRRWLKGSPDGVALVPVRDAAGKMVGVEPYMVEIKCPARSFIPGKIARKYYPQVQLCMFLTGIHKCHFMQYIPPSKLSDETLDLVTVEFDPQWFAWAQSEAFKAWLVVLHRRRGMLGYAQPPKPDVKHHALPECVENPPQKKSRSRTLAKVDTTGTGVEFVTHDDTSIEEPCACAQCTFLELSSSDENTAAPQ